MGDLKMDINKINSYIYIRIGNKEKLIKNIKKEKIDGTSNNQKIHRRNLAKKA